MKISTVGFALIRRWEGCELEAYQDQAGVWTIGYGHTSAAGEPKVTEGMTISKDEATVILKRDLMKFEAGVIKALKRAPTQSQFDAMVSLALNIGTGAFRRSSFLRRFNAGDIAGAAEALCWWNKITDPATGGKRISRGLVNRREAERALFLSDAGQDVLDISPKGRPVGGEHKPLGKSKTVSLGAVGVFTSALTLWAQFREGAPEIIEAIGPYAPWLLVIVCAAVIANRWVDSRRGVH